MSHLGKDNEKNRFNVSRVSFVVLMTVDESVGGSFMLRSFLSLDFSFMY